MNVMPKTISIISVIISLTLLSFLFDGAFTYMSGDDAYAITAIEKKYDSSLYHDDLQVASMVKSYFTAYYECLYFWGNRIGIKSACIIFQLISRLLLYSSLLFLGYSLFKSFNIGLLTAFMFITHKTVLAWGNITATTLHPQFLALPVLLYGFAFLFRGNMLTSSIIIAASIYIHATTAIWGMIIFPFCWLALEGYKNMKKSIISASAAVIILLPFAMLYFSMFPVGKGIYDVNLIEALARWRLAYHIFPSYWPIYQTLLKIIDFSGFAVFGYIGVRNNARLRNLLIAIISGTLLLWTAGFIMSEIHYTPLINKLQFIRASFIEYILLSVFLANYIWTKMSQSYSENKFSNLALYIFASVFLCLPGVGKMQFAGLFLLTANLFLNLKYLDNLMSRIYKNLLFCCKKLEKQHVSNLLFLVVLILITIIFFSANIKTLEPKLKEAALWANSNTAKQDLFITHPTLAEGFRYWAKRPQLPDWKDGGIANYDYAYGLKFLEIMKLYGFTPGMDESQLEKVRAEDIIRAGIAAEARYALLPFSEDFLDKRIVFNNDKWLILDLKK